MQILSVESARDRRWIAFETERSAPPLVVRELLKPRAEAPMFQRILVPTDFSPGADAALRYARAIAERFGASLYLLHVLSEPMLAGALGTEVLVAEVQTLQETTHTDAERKLDALLAPDVSAGLQISADIVVGAPAAAIVDFARDRDIDLIVVGTHTRSGVAHLLLGSVAETIARKASCPVLTVLVPPDEVPSSLLDGAAVPLDA